MTGPTDAAVAPVDVGTGLRRMRAMWRLWRAEVDDPAPFYGVLAAELAADLERRHGRFEGQTLVDLGCGPGFYAAALAARGARVMAVDLTLDEMRNGDLGRPERAVLADARALPLQPSSVDGVVCSNLLEHTPDVPAVFDELTRVMRSGAWAYVSWTNWYSPWGGHEMSPYHYLGPERGSRLYERRHGPPRKNRYGEGLWPVHIGATLRDLRRRPELRVDRVEPRYWPRLRAISSVPGLREVASWNCVIRLTRM